MAEYIQRGESIDYTNNSDTKIKANDVVVMTGHIGVAGCDIEIGQTGSLHLVGVYKMPTDTESFEIGQAAYYDAAAKKITPTATNNIPAGWVIAKVTKGENYALVKIG